MIRILEYGAANTLLKRSDDRLVQALIVVESIVSDVRSRGDAAVREYAAQFDGRDFVSAFDLGEDGCALGWCHKRLTGSTTPDTAPRQSPPRSPCLPR